MPINDRNDASKWLNLIKRAIGIKANLKAQSKGMIKKTRHNTTEPQHGKAQHSKAHNVKASHAHTKKKSTSLWSIFASKIKQQSLCISVSVTHEYVNTNANDRYLIQ